MSTKFYTKIRILKFGNKNALFGCFGQQLWKTIVIFEIRGLQFALWQSLVQKTKILKFGTKNVRFAYFDMENIIVIFEISIIDFALLENLVRKQNPSILDQKCVAWVILGWNLKTISSYLKSAPSNLANHKIFPKTKMTKFGTKNTLFGYFWASI